MNKQENGLNSIATGGQRDDHVAKLTRVGCILSRRKRMIMSYNCISSSLLCLIGSRTQLSRGNAPLRSLNLAPYHFCKIFLQYQVDLNEHIAFCTLRFNQNQKGPLRTFQLGKMLFQIISFFKRYVGRHSSRQKMCMLREVLVERVKSEQKIHISTLKTLAINKKSINLVLSS